MHAQIMTHMLSKEFHDRLELLRDDGLPRVSPQSRRIHPQERRELDFLGSGRDDIPETDVDLKVDPGLSERRLQPHPLAAVLLGFADRFDRDGTYVETKPVVRYQDATNFREDLPQLLAARVAESEQVQVAGRPVHHPGPEG